jgi:hypothetical protein
MTISEYLLDNRTSAAERRFGALSALFDDVTFRHIAALGIQPGPLVSRAREVDALPARLRHLAKRCH